MTEILGVGHFVAWPGGCMLIGQAHRATGVHSHYALQLSIGEDDGICFRHRADDAWTAYDGAVISSRQPHAMDASTVAASATILIELETPAGRAMTERFAQGGISPITRKAFAAHAANLFEVWRRDRGGDDTARAARDVVNAVAGTSEGEAIVSDERVLRAVAYINEHLAETLTLKGIAGEVFLSPTRFRHLFVEQTGTALRPYVLWRRFLRSWSLIRQGMPISSAAHGAGFADAAHLTRTSQRMFGFAPSALLVNSPTDRS